MLARKTWWEPPELGNRHGFPFQVADRADLVRAEQLEAANVDSAQQDDGQPLSTCTMKGAMKAMLMSTSPEAMAL